MNARSVAPHALALAVALAPITRAAVSQLNPPAQSTEAEPTTTVSATLTPDVGLLDLLSLELQFDGSPVAAVIAPIPETPQPDYRVTYLPFEPLPPGSAHNAQVSYTDGGGSPAPTSWSFTVRADATLPQPLRLSAEQIPGPKLRLDWEGGVSPFLVQESPSLLEWFDYLRLDGRSTEIDMVETAKFFRVLPGPNPGSPISFSATLDDFELPFEATGSVDFTLSNDVLEFELLYADLGAPPNTLFLNFGASAPDQLCHLLNLAPLIPPGATASGSIAGSVRLRPAEIAEFLAGEGRINLGTAASPEGVLSAAIDPTETPPIVIYNGLPSPQAPGERELTVPEPDSHGGAIIEHMAADWCYGVDLASGEFRHREIDFRISGRGFDFVWARRYRSQNTEHSGMGKRWDFSYNIFLTADPCGDLVLSNGNGRQDRYKLQPGGTWVADGFFREIVHTGGGYEVRMPNAARWILNPLDESPTEGKINTIQDRNGNAMTFAHDASGRLTTVIDTHGRTQTVTWTSVAGLDRIESVTDHTGREWAYSYAGAADPDGSPGALLEATSPTVTGTPHGNDFPAGRSTSYAYTIDPVTPEFSDLMTRITDPRGNDWLANYYHTSGLADRDAARLKRQDWGDAGDSIHFAYRHISNPNVNNNFATRLVIVNDRVGNVKHLYCDHRNDVVMLREYTGRAPDPDTWTYLAHNLPANPLRAGDPAFFETRVTYNDDHLTTLLERHEGDTIAFTYDSANTIRRAQGNLLGRTHTAGPRGGDQASLAEAWTYHATLLGPQFVETHTDRRGHVTSHAYDTAGNRTQTVHRIPSIVEDWEYNAFGQLTAIVHPDNGSGHRRRDEFTYYDDTAGPQEGYLQSRIVDAAGFVLTTGYEWDLAGNLIRVTDPNGGETQYTRNALDEVVQVLSREVSTTSGPVRYERLNYFDENGNVVQFDTANVDGDGDLDALFPVVAVSYDYETLNRRIRETRQVDPANNVVTEYGYDANRNRTLVRSGEATNGNQPENTVTSIHDERDLLFQEILAEGHAYPSTTQWDFDGDGAWIMVSQGLEGADPRFTTYTRDGYGRCTELGDAMGNRLLLSWDENSNLVNRRLDGELDDVPGPAGNLRLTEAGYEWDDMDRLVTRDRKHFDPATQADIGDGSSLTTWAWSNASQVLSSTNDNAHATSYTYDTTNRRLAETDAAGNSRTYTYDGNNNILFVDESDSSDLGNPDELFTNSYTYDGLNRLVTRTDNIGNSSAFAYDSRGNLVRTFDARDNTVDYEYDGLSRLVSTTRTLTDDGTGNGTVTGAIVTLQTWDDSSRPATSTDANGNLTTYSYDPLGRRIRTDLADGTSHSATYDVHHNLIRTTDANGTEVDHAYDLLNRRTQSQVALLGPDIDPAHQLAQYSYDGCSRAIVATDEDSVVIREHDSLSNLMSEDLDGRVTGAEYDGAGNQIQCVYPGGRTIERVYDERERVTQIIDGATTIAHHHYVGPRVEGVDFGNGTRAEFTYDGITGIPNPTGDFGVRRIHRTLHTRVSDGMVIDDRRYRYDQVQNKRARRDDRPGQAAERFEHLYGYDSVYRLVRTEVLDRNSLVKRDEQYTLDAFGNRSVVTGGLNPGPYTMDPATPVPADEQVNQYTTTALDARIYDDNGNLRTIDAGLASERNYTYDWQNRLVQLDDAATGQTHTYAYDAFGRRTVRTVDSTGAAFGPAETRYFYDGRRVIEERDGTGTTTATYVHRIIGEEANDVIGMSRGGTDYYYHADNAGNVMALTDNAGALVERHDYGDYGQILDPLTLNPPPGPPSAVGNPLFANGRRFDPESGFYHGGGSYFDPLAGRFTSRAGTSGATITDTDDTSANFTSRAGKSDLTFGSAGFPFAEVSPRAGAGITSGAAEGTTGLASLLRAGAGAANGLSLYKASTIVVTNGAGGWFYIAGGSGAADGFMMHPGESFILRAQATEVPSVVVAGEVPDFNHKVALTKLTDANAGAQDQRIGYFGPVDETVGEAVGNASIPAIAGLQSLGFDNTAAAVTKGLSLYPHLERYQGNPALEWFITPAGEIKGLSRMARR